MGSVTRKLMGILVLGAMLCGAANAASAEEGRKVKSKGSPVYPELAKKMNVSGTVKVEVVVAANGSVKSAKALGGHPLLINAALDAAKQFKYEASSDETKETISFNFTPGNQ